MNNSWLIAVREWKERIGTRSFVLMSVIGPILILLLTYLLFAFGGEGKQNWKVLITDPAGIMENKILAHEDKSVVYYFSFGYLKNDLIFIIFNFINNGYFFIIFITLLEWIIFLYFFYY